MRALFPIGLYLALLLVATTSSAQWTQHRGPTGDGHAPAADLPLEWSDEENVAWKTPIHGRGYSSPIVLGDQVWLTTATTDGKQMFAIAVDRRSGEIIHDIKVFENAEPADTRQYNTYASPTPVAEAGRVYVHFGSYGTAALDAKTGEAIWTRRDLPLDHYRGPGSSPILFDDLLILTFDGFDYQYVAALNKHTGETVWKVDRNIEYGTDNGDFKKGYSTPLVIEVGGEPQLISPAAKAAIAYNPYTGEELWKVRYEQHSAAARPVAGEGRVYINTGFGKSTLLAVETGGSGDVTGSHLAWEVKQAVPRMSSQLLLDGLIYMFDDRGIATALDAATGEEVWQKRVGATFYASPIYADGRIYAIDHEGRTIVLAPGREFDLLAENQLTFEKPYNDHYDHLRASPAVADDALFIRLPTHLVRVEEASGE